MPDTLEYIGAAIVLTGVMLFVIAIMTSIFGWTLVRQMTGILIMMGALSEIPRRMENQPPMAFDSVPLILVLLVGVPLGALIMTGAWWQTAQLLADLLVDPVWNLIRCRNTGGWARQHTRRAGFCRFIRSLS
jgi:hypothetical protein